MHRTFSAPRRFGWWSLLIALALHVGIQAASAQNPLQFTQENLQQAQPIELAVGMTRPCQMTTRADLKRVENPNSRIVRVERIPDKHNEVLLVAEGPGRTLITLVDQNDRTETHEIIVQAGGGKEVAKGLKLKMNKGSQETRRLDAPPLGGVTISKNDVADVIIVKDDPTSRTVVFRALAVGATRITFLSAKKEVIAVYDVEVTTTDRAAQLRKLIAELAPAASVTVTETKIPRKRSNQEPRGKQDDEAEFDEAVVLSGTANDAAEARLIFEAAQRLFPPTDLGQGAVPVGGGVAQQSQLQGNVINNIRIGGVHTVQLEVVVAVVNRSELRNMSFSWLHSSNNWFISSLIGGQGLLNSGLVIPPTAVSLNSSGANLPFGVLNGNGGTIGFLNALRTEGLAKIYAEPRVTTLSGRPASILSGGEVPIVLATGVGAPPSVTYKEFGTKVNFLPVVLGNGKIHLEVRPELSERDASLDLNIAGINAPGFRTRSAQVTVQLEDGQTLAIGGLIQNTVNATINRVPFLGDIPFLGMAFTSKSFNETEQELIILVTPRLVDGVDCTKIPKYLPGRDTRCPDDFELFLEGIMEAPRGQRSVIFHPHYYKGAHTLAPNAGQIPCGDGSCYRRGHSGCVKGGCAPASLGVVHAQHTTEIAPPRVTEFASPRITDIAPPRVATPSTPQELPVLPPMNLPPVTMEPEPPVVLPPVTPVVPMSSRQPESRPLLPPISR